MFFYSLQHTSSVHQIHLDRISSFLYGFTYVAGPEVGKVGDFEFRGYLDEIESEKIKP